MSKKLLIFILFVSSILMFINLGDRFVWTDESETAFCANSILKHGYPSAVGEKNIMWIGAEGLEYEYFTDQNFPKINGYPVEFRPWLPVYLTAGFFYLFGDSFFVLRFPFALAAFFTILFIYVFVKKATNNPRLAVLSSLLLSVFVPFYLYSRIGRYYPLLSLFSLLVLISYLKILNKERFGTLFFILSNIALFYTLPSAFLGIAVGVAVHFLLFKFNWKIFLKSLIPSAIIVSLVGLPWLLFINYGMSDFNAVAILLGIINLIAYIFLYIFPFVFVFGLPLLIFKREKSKIKFNSFFCLILLCILFGVLAATLQPWGFNIPLRYIPFLFPLFMILIAGIILKLAYVSRYIAFLTVFFLVFTNCLYIFPFNLAGDMISDKIENEPLQLFIQDNLQFRSLIIEFLYEITHHYSTPNEKIVDFIWSHGANKTDVLLTNYDMNVLHYTADMYLYQKGIVDKKPDWIVLRAPIAYVNPEPYMYVKQFITSDYERFIIPASDYRYQRDSPHPRLHRFKELDTPIVYTKYPHEVDFIEIYKLKNLA